MLASNRFCSFLLGHHPGVVGIYVHVHMHVCKRKQRNEFYTLRGMIRVVGG